MWTALLVLCALFGYLVGVLVARWVARRSQARFIDDLCRRASGIKMRVRPGRVVRAGDLVTFADVEIDPKGQK